MPKKIFKRLKAEYENANLEKSEGMSSLERSFEKILGINDIWDIFWDSGATDTFLDGGDLLGLYHPYLKVEDLNGNEIFDQEINIRPYIDNLYRRFGYAADVLWNSETNDSEEAVKEWPKGIITNNDSKFGAFNKMPYLFFACECLKGIQWVAEIDIEGEFDINMLSPIVQEYPEGVYLVVGLAYNGTELDLDSEHELDGSGYADYFFSLIPSFEKLELNGLTELSDTAAQAFSKHKGTLCLNGLTSLTDNAAKFLSNHVGILELNGLVSLSDEVAKSFTSHLGKLSLGGLKDLSNNAKNILASHQANPSLNVVDFTNADSGNSVPGNKNILSLNHLDYLSFTDFLSDFQGWSIELNGLIELSDEVAEILGEFEGDLSLNGLTFLSDRGAMALSNGTVPEEIQGETITEDETKKLVEKAQEEDELKLNHITYLPLNAAIQLSMFSGWIELNGLKTITDGVAKALSRRHGVGLSLNGLTKLSDHAAVFLSINRALYLNGLTKISDKALEALSNLETLELNGLTNLSDNAAKAFAKPMWGLELNGLTTLTEKAAQALSMHVGYLGLNGLISTSDEVIEALSNHKGRLKLNGLTSLSDLAAIALSRRVSWDCSKALNSVSLYGIETISDFALGIIGESIGYEIDIESPAILSRVERCIQKKNENQFEKVLIKNLNEEKLIGRKIAASVIKKWGEDFIDEDTGETVSIERNEIIIEANKKITKKDITEIINSGVEFIFLEKEFN
jgi:hypothetical protein